MRFVLSSCYFLGFPLTNRLPIEVPSNCLLKHSRYMKRKQKATYWIYWAFTSKTMNNDTLYPAQTQCNCESWKLKHRSHKEWWRYLQFPFLFTSFLGSPTTCSSSVLVWFPRPDDSTPHFCLLLPWTLTCVCSRKIAAWKTWKKRSLFWRAPSVLIFGWVVGSWSWYFQKSEPLFQFHTRRLAPECFKLLGERQPGWCIICMVSYWR